MGSFPQTLTATPRSRHGSRSDAIIPACRGIPNWRTPALPFYQGAQVVGFHHQVWSYMTAVVVELRCETDFIVNLNANFTRICISLEEVGGNFLMFGDRRLIYRAPTPRGAAGIIAPGSRAYGRGNRLKFMRQLLLQVNKRSLNDAFGSFVNVEAALTTRIARRSSRVSQLAQIVAEECSAGSVMNRSYGDGITMALLSARAEVAESDNEPTETRGGLAPWRLNRVTQYLFENLSEHLDLEAQATVAGLSKSHYCRAFKVSMGISPHQWLLNARIEQAKQHLLVGTLPLAEIALAVGFTNQVHFTHTFTRNEGISPRLWQRSRGALAQ